MRNEFAKAIERIASTDDRIVFLTGDLGYNALESVRIVLKDRFINAGVAEQNMITIASAMASQGMIPICYSIAPFCVFRPYEQIKVDVCLHNANVKIVGNGGGYGYGIMGSTHHALEDLAAMRLLPNMRSYIPTFAEDVSQAVEAMILQDGPGYLRLNLAAKLPQIQPITRPPFSTWRKLSNGASAVAIVCGPVVDRVLEIDAELLRNYSIWLMSELPHGMIPDRLVAEITAHQTLVTIEEHVGPGGIGEAIAAELMDRGILCRNFRRLRANHYPSGRYGSQRWHQNENSLGGVGLVTALTDTLENRRAATNRR